MTPKTPTEQAGALSPEEMAEKFSHKQADYWTILYLKHCYGKLTEWDKIKLASENSFLAAYNAAQRWIPVSESLPEQGKLVNVCNPNSVPPTYGWYVGNGRWIINDEPTNSFTKTDMISFITHWMPLPPAPKEDEK